MPYKFRPAKRSNSRVLVGLFGKSGSGKTWTSLVVGRGLIGPEGKLGMADTESGRGELFADVPEIGGYEYIEIIPPFTPAAYIDAIDSAEKQGVQCLVIDSMSHVWEGEGGVLEVARANEARTGKAGLHNWNKPKQELNALVLRILRSKLHIFACLRARRKSRQIIDKGKTVISRDGFYTPKMDEGFISDMLCFGELLGIDDPRGAPHSLIVGKVTHPKVAEFWKDGVIPSKRTGELFARWAKDSNFKVSEADQKPAGAVQRQAPPIIETRDNDSESEGAGGGARPDHGEPQFPNERPPFAPEGGWPRFTRISEWGTYSKKFLADADSHMGESWRGWWSGFWDSLQEMVAEKKPLAVELMGELESLLKAAMKRQPKEPKK